MIGVDRPATWIGSPVGSAKASRHREGATLATGTSPESISVVAATGPAAASATDDHGLNASATNWVCTAACGAAPTPAAVVELPSVLLAGPPKSPVGRGSKLVPPGAVSDEEKRREVFPAAGESSCATMWTAVDETTAGCSPGTVKPSWRLELRDPMTPTTPMRA